MKVREAIASAGIEPREARILLAEVCGFSQAALAAAPEQEIPFEVENAFLDLTSKRRAGVPVAYLLGRKEFYGLDLAVNPSVLIPRPETELLVDLALERRAFSILDLGTGSGAVALAIKFHSRQSRVAAVEADLAALVTARRNAAKLNLEVDFRHGRWFQPVAGERFDLIVVDPLTFKILARRRAFSEENNVWVRGIMRPILCNYRLETSFPEDEIALYIPQEGERVCP